MKNILFYLLLIFSANVYAQNYTGGISNPTTTGSFSGVSYSKIASGQTINFHNMNSGGKLYDGRIYSPNRNYYLSYQTDGNLVLYKTANNQAIWASNTVVGQAAVTCIMQTDGNLVVYATEFRKRSGRAASWASNTNGNNGAFLAIQNDGNMVIYNAANTQALWATGTNGR